MLRAFESAQETARFETELCLQGAFQRVDNVAQICCKQMGASVVELQSGTVAKLHKRQ